MKIYIATGIGLAAVVLFHCGFHTWWAAPVSGALVVVSTRVAGWK